MKKLCKAAALEYITMFVEDGYYALLAEGWRFYYQRQGEEAVVYWMQKHSRRRGG